MQFFLDNQPLLEDLPEPADFPQTQSRYSSQFPFSERIQKSTQDSRGDTVMSASSGKRRLLIPDRFWNRKN